MGLFLSLSLFSPRSPNEVHGKKYKITSNVIPPTRRTSSEETMRIGYEAKCMGFLLSVLCSQGRLHVRICSCKSHKVCRRIGHNLVMGSCLGSITFASDFNFPSYQKSSILKPMNSLHYPSKQIQLQLNSKISLQQRVSELFVLAFDFNFSE